ncbi:phenylalanine--tRNA ligase subunit alpha [Candidatus Uhrbacteria bacterium]|nr:phenylalanine--tRNA ligase subunit alpha [Candidatus Uhrbacteria bacterium]
MENALRALRGEIEAALAGVTDTERLEAVRVEFLGRKGRLAELMKGLAALSPDEKKAVGVVANDVKLAAESAFAEAEARVTAAEQSAKAEREWLDVTLPGTPPSTGHLHLTSQAIEDITNIFTRVGFVRSRHPEIDWDYYAFASLNMPKEHPARDEWETFFVADDEGKDVRTGAKGKVVLTPHTSNGQVREMEKGELPIRMISIGKCYRRQATARHLPMFHQFEGLVIDTHASVTELKGVCDYFAKSYFGPDRVTRLRPFHFRFTEPSFELDISCGVCGGTGKVNGVKCKLCKEGWLELGGAGMVHPNVIKAGGLDPEKYSGFAFGWGVERTMMMRAGVNIDDIRILYRNDLRFITQF